MTLILTLIFALWNQMEYVESNAHKATVIEDIHQWWLGLSLIMLKMCTWLGSAINQVADFSWPRRWETSGGSFVRWQEAPTSLCLHFVLIAAGIFSFIVFIISFHSSKRKEEEIKFWFQNSVINEKTKKLKKYKTLNQIVLALAVTF